mgnify:CR=1 FL=1
MFKGEQFGRAGNATRGTTPPNSDHVMPEGLRSRVRSRGLIRTRFRPLVGRERTVAPMNKLLTVGELSTCIHKSVSSIRSDATRNPQSLPPICRLPGTKRLLWRLEDVEHWLGVHVATTPPAAVVEPSRANQPRRGRPTKAEQLARRRETAKATRHAADDQE